MDQRSCTTVLLQLATSASINPAELWDAIRPEPSGTYIGDIPREHPLLARLATGRGHGVSRIYLAGTDLYCDIGPLTLFPAKGFAYFETEPERALLKTTARLPECAVVAASGMALGALVDLPPPFSDLLVSEARNGAFGFQVCLRSRRVLF